MTIETELALETALKSRISVLKDQLRIEEMMLFNIQESIKKYGRVECEFHRRKIDRENGT